ncbi:hypothetical protein PIB30_088846, partial [Stylosanthes scabra]|nr:hypothetical protein [Stylosanthes scabra]
MTAPSSPVTAPAAVDKSHASLASSLSFFLLPLASPLHHHCTAIESSIFFFTSHHHRHPHALSATFAVSTSRFRCRRSASSSFIADLCTSSSSLSFPSPPSSSRPALQIC